MKRIFFALSALLFLHALQAQKLGIGITNPTRAALEVHGAVGATSAIFGGDGAGIALMRDWPTIDYNYYYNGTSRYLANSYAASQTVDPTQGYMAFDFVGQGVTDGAVNKLPGMTSTAYLFGTTHHSTFNFGTNITSCY